VPPRAAALALTCRACHLLAQDAATAQLQPEQRKLLRLPDARLGSGRPPLPSPQRGASTPGSDLRQRLVRLRTAPSRALRRPLSQPLAHATSRAVLLAGRVRSAACARLTSRRAAGQSLRSFPSDLSGLRFARGAPRPGVNELATGNWQLTPPFRALLAPSRPHRTWMTICAGARLSAANILFSQTSPAVHSQACTAPARDLWLRPLLPAHSRLVRHLRRSWLLFAA